MTISRRPAFMVLLLGGLFMTGQAQGQSDEGATDGDGDRVEDMESADEANANATSTKPVALREMRIPYERKWESGFDIQRTTIVEDGATMFSARWMRRFWTDTSIGGAVSALPLSVERTKDDIPVKVGLLTYGAAVEQVLFSSWPLRVSAAFSAGVGQIYARYQPDDEPEELKTENFRYFEPAAYVFFLNRWRLNMGVMAGTRIVSMKTDNPVGGGDVTGLVFGLSFRTLM